MHSTSNPKQANPDADVLVASVPEGLAKAIAQVSKLEREPVRYSLDPKIPMNTFRPTVPRDRPARRGLIGLILAACIFVAAFALQSSYGDAVTPIIARWAPQFVPTSSQLLEKPGLSAQTSPPSVQAAPEVAQLLQTMMRDLANVDQEMKQLKTSQEEMARDSAKVAEQVKASQVQVARLMAKANEQKPKPPAPPARTLPAPQATTKPQAPPQLQAEKP